MKERKFILMLVWAISMTSCFVDRYDDDNQDPVLMLDEYERKGLAFLVDVGVMHNPASTVIDLSSGSPKLIRRGAGDASMWVDEDEDPTLASDDEAWGF